MKKTDVMKSLSGTRPASLKPVDDPERLDRIIAAATTRPSTVRVVPPRGSIKLGWGLGTAGVVAAGLAVAVTLVPGGAGDRSAEPAARGLLLAAAEQTVKVPTVTGRYWHTRGVNWGGVHDGRSSHGVCRDETWVARSPKDPSWWIVHSWTRVDAVKGAKPPKEGEGSSDQAHFICARGNRGLGGDGTGKTPYAGRLNDFAEPGSSWPNVNGKAVSVDDIERLPTEPEALKGVLIQWQVPGTSDTRRDEILFQQAAELLLELPAPSGVRAALFRLMADLPEVRSLGDVRDPLGRDAVGVALRSCEPGYGTERQVLFDKDTGRLLSVGTSVGQQGCADLRPANWSAILESRWTDESPKVPADHA
ncbi:CU044_5270 family protein [Nonomuraea wenchangensis]